MNEIIIILVVLAGVLSLVAVYKQGVSRGVEKGREQVLKENIIRVKLVNDENRKMLEVVQSVISNQ